MRFGTLDFTPALDSPELLAAPTEVVLAGLPADQRFAAEVEGADPATYPGIYGVFPLELALPGPGPDPRLVPCAGLTWVGVHPDERRRGISERRGFGVGHGTIMRAGSGPDGPG